MSRQKDEQIRKTRAVIQGILALKKSRASRTELVKLVYLADNRFYESTGRTITGNLYMWDHYGPNAVGNAIVSEADQLVRLGALRMATGPSMYGGETYWYWIDDPSTTWENAAPALDEGERQVVMDIVRQYGKLSLKSLVSESKQTQPFKDAQQYDPLRLLQNEKAAEMRKLLQSSGAFLEEGRMALKEADEEKWVWDEELDR